MKVYVEKFQPQKFETQRTMKDGRVDVEMKPY